MATVIVDKDYAAVTGATHRAVVLVKGRVVYQGPSTELRGRPELVRQYLGL